MTTRKMAVVAVLVTLAALALTLGMTPVGSASMELAQDKGPGILEAALGAARAPVGRAGSTAAKNRLFGGWSVEVEIDGAVVDEEELSAKDGEAMLKFSRPWWLVLLFGGDPVLEMTREVRQNLQSNCTRHGNVIGDVKKYAGLDLSQRKIVIRLKSGATFKPHAAPKPAPQA